MFRRLLAVVALTATALSFTAASVSADGGDTYAANAEYAAKLTVGREHTCLIADGDVYCWGNNSYGQLGQNATSVLTANFPAKVSGISNAIAVSAGSEHTCAVVTGGNVYCWGRDNYANGSSSGGLQYTPQLISGVSNATAVASGDTHTCALLSDTTVKCWGQNSGYQLGNASGSTTTPTAVSGLTGVVSLAAGSNHTCVALSDGSAKCWGYNMAGQVGSGNYTNQSSPTAVTVAAGGTISGAVAVTAGNNHSCVVTSSKGAFCWGDNMYGELGTASATGGSNYSAYPVRAARSSGSAASDVIGISAGEYYTCILRDSGAAACFGVNDAGQVGNGVTGSSNLGPDTVGTVSGAQVITTGRNTTCAMSATALWCWGSGTYGQIGNSTNNSQNTSPAPVVGFRSQSVTFPGPSNTSVTSGTVSLSATSSSGGPVSFSSQTSSVCTVSGSTVTLVAPGTCTIRAWSAVYGTYAVSANVDRSFTVSGASPTARTAAATSISSARATLNATVNARGIDTTVTFSWGQKSDLSDASSVDARTVTGLTDTDVSATLTGLTENSTYYYRVVAVNTAGTIRGDIVAFTSTRPVGLSVNDAAEFTNKKAVTLYATGPSGATQVIVSNDGGFKSSQTFSLTDGYAEIAWTLVASRDERLPKTVYARFVQRFGTQSANYSDDIILDTTAPTMTGASGASTGPSSDNVTVQGVRITAAKGAVRLTVRASDKNSGIGKVQVKGSSSGSPVDVSTGSPKATSRTVKVNTTKKKLWVRVVDRAGNVSKWVTVTVK